MNGYEETLVQILADPQYSQNLDWGVPRAGHPEGSIRAHISEMEGFLKVLSAKLTTVEVIKLKILIHTHDTFKPDAEPKVPIVDSRSHASLARSFLSRFTEDQELLNIVQFHDEPYAIWKKARYGGDYQTRFKDLLGVICDWDLFLAFVVIDGCTDGKSIEPLNWFFAELPAELDTRVNSNWIEYLRH